jgi:Trypsin
MPVWMRGGVLKGSVCTLLGLACSAFVGCDRQASEDLARNESPIIGGKLDTADKGVVSLLKQVQGGYYPACSGTLLTQNLVLTAHHCVAALSSADGASVECGKTEFQALDQASKLLVSVEANVGNDGLNPFRVSQIWVPPGDSAVCGRDIALLLLTSNGVPATAAKPIEPSLTRELAADEVFAAIGFGLQDPKDETGETAGHRMSVTDAKVFCEGAACGTDLVKEGEFIADSPVCSGDSGGPALDKDGRVCGVTSRGDEKCTVGIYSSVSAWRDFIIEKTFVAAESGHYNPPAWAGAPPPGFDPGIVPMGGSNGVAGSGGASSSGGSAGSITLAGTGPITVVGGGPGAGGGSSSASPTIDPLGLSCTGICPGSYKCWAATGKPPGICVPECSAAQTTCPSGFTCDTGLLACIKQTKTTSVQHSGSCSVSSASGAPGNRGAAWLGLGLLGFACCGRRARRRASGI